MIVLVTGGTGYIGSHTCVELLEAGHQVVILDNLSNSYQAVIERLESITGKRPEFYQADLLNSDALDEVFSKHCFDAVIHFAGLKAVGESVANPLLYYRNNVLGSMNLIEAMQKANVKQLVFSSSATVYGEPEGDSANITEDFRLQPTNPYGQSKLMVENILRDACVADGDLKVALLRYFNPVGAHKSGLIGEDPQGIPNNLMPFIAQVAVGRREALSVFGDDYDTADGTGVRDYIHVVDLAQGHVKALEHIDSFDGAEVINLGTGKGSSVLEMLASYAKAAGKDIPYHIVERRPGDVAQLVAAPAFAKTRIGWQASLTLDDMTADGWHWQKNNPQGYSTK